LNLDGYGKVQPVGLPIRLNEDVRDSQFRVGQQPYILPDSDDMLPPERTGNIVTPPYCPRISIRLDMATPTITSFEKNIIFALRFEDQPYRLYQNSGL